MPHHNTQIINIIKIYLKILESNIGSSVLGTLKYCKRLNLNRLQFSLSPRVNHLRTTTDFIIINQFTQY